MTKQSESKSKSKSKVVLTFILSILTMLFSGFVLSTCWGWFIVPLGVLPIGIFHAMGLVLVGVIVSGVLSLTSKIIENNKESSSSTSKELTRLLAIIISLAMLLGEGYILYIFMNL